jgi:hypothetical protein
VKKLSVTQIPTAKLGRLVILSLAVFLLMPLVVEMPLDSYMAGHAVGYLSELEHNWIVYLMFAIGLIVSCIRRRRNRGR